MEVHKWINTIPLGGSHTTAKMTATATVTFTVWNVTANNRSHLNSNTKRKWRTSYFVDLHSLHFIASRRFPERRNHCRSRSWSRIRSELPSESAQEPCSTVEVLISAHMAVSCLSASESHFAFDLLLLQPSLTFSFARSTENRFRICQTWPWPSPLPSPWQQMPRRRSRHVRLTATVTVRNVKCDRRNVTSPSPSPSFSP